ncbi:hypothetical protein ACFOSV_12200 [Algoriphagus namhaensis]|uniref:Uncharacterized protein n=1 Tax=Algoriphagus namhaensis TaxID=915353 RepID=A0ABV8ASQ6_9BACT
MRDYFLNILVVLILILGEFGYLFSFLIYGKYLSLLIFFVLIFQSRFKIRKGVIGINSLIFPFVIIVFLNFVQFFNFSIYPVIESIIILSAVLPFISTTNFNFYPRFVFLCLLVSFFIKTGFDFNLSLSVDSFLKSETSSNETNLFSFIFGFFAIYFFYVKNKTYFVLSVIVVILTFKRIVFISLFITILFSILRLDKLKNMSLLVILSNLFWVLISYVITTDWFFDFSVEFFNLSPGFLTKGRSTVYGLLFDNYEGLNIIPILFGFGAAEARISLLSYDIGISLIHNDVLKLFYEYGVFVFISFFVFLYRNNSKAILFSVYLNCLFFTDNVFIYAPVIFLFFLLSMEYTRVLNMKKCLYLV